MRQIGGGGVIRAADWLIALICVYMREYVWEYVCICVYLVVNRCMCVNMCMVYMCVYAYRCSTRAAD